MLALAIAMLWSALIDLLFKPGDIRGLSRARVIEFSAYSVGSMLLVDAVCFFVFRERLSGWRKLAVVLTALGFVLTDP
jgi:hypothetical protein